MTMPSMAPPQAGPDGALNTPPRLPPMPQPPPGMPGMPGGGPSGPMSTDAAASAVAGASRSEPPTLGEPTVTSVDLPGGWISPSGFLVRTAEVRELNGYDEEKLARLDRMKNVALYVTELLCLGVEAIDGVKPSRDVIRQLLIGDRDALVLGISRATYGDGVEFRLDCTNCGNQSEVEVELDKDIEVTVLEDPLKRLFDIELRNGGKAKVQLLTGITQEAVSENIGSRTQAEIDTALLAKSVVDIDGKPVHGDEDAVRRLSSADRNTLTSFIGDNQPGPQLSKEIMVECATCHQEFPILLGLGNLFRF